MRGSTLDHFCGRSSLELAARESMVAAMDDIATAVDWLRRGGLVALPTETVYGLGANAQNEVAVRRIFAVKQRPQSHPLIVHLAGASALSAWARNIPKTARVLAEAFWPGPLTMVLRRSAMALDVVTGGQNTVALRVPAHPLALEVLRAFGRGIAAPSANRFGCVSPTTADHVRSDLGREVDFVLDGGRCAVGVESTIVDLTSQEPAVLRPGGLSFEALEAVLGKRPALMAQSDVRAPGMLASHYAPRAGLELTDLAALSARATALVGSGVRVAIIAPKQPALPGGVGFFELPGDPAAMARQLYATLREIDLAGYERILAVLPPAAGLGATVRDRLTRASRPP